MQPIAVQVDHARRHVAETEASRLELLRETIQLAADLGHDWPGRKADPARVDDAFVAIIVSRTVTTAWAAYELASIGFGAQAQMLNRSLFEDMVDAHWVTVEPSVAHERYRDHFEHSRMLFR